MNVLDRLLAGSGGDELVLEPMRKRHLSQVLAIEEEAYPRGWSYRLFVKEIDQVRDGTRYYVVARRGRTVLGYAGVMFVVDEAHVTNVAVAESARRQGVASRMLLRLADEVIARGCTAWTLEVRINSTGAQALYRSFGFAPVGVRPHYYDGITDAVVMWCHDIQSATYAERLEGLR